MTDGQVDFELHLSLGQVILFPYFDHCRNLVEVHNYCVTRSGLLLCHNCGLGIHCQCKGSLYAAAMNVTCERGTDNQETLQQSDGSVCVCVCYEMVNLRELSNVDFIRLLVQLILVVDFHLPNLNAFRQFATSIC